MLYFDHGKGRGKMLGGDRRVYFAHFSAIVGTGIRIVVGGQLVEFTPRFGSSCAFRSSTERRFWGRRSNERPRPTMARRETEVVLGTDAPPLRVIGKT